MKFPFFFTFSIHLQDIFLNNTCLLYVISIAVIISCVDLVCRLAREIIPTVEEGMECRGLLKSLEMLCFPLCLIGENRKAGRRILNNVVHTIKFVQILSNLFNFQSSIYYCHCCVEACHLAV